MPRHFCLAKNSADFILPLTFRVTEIRGVTDSTSTRSISDCSLPATSRQEQYTLLPDPECKHLLCSSMQSNSAVAVAETVQHFITAMDSLKLNMVAVDQVRLQCCIKLLSQTL